MFQSMLNPPDEYRVQFVAALPALDLDQFIEFLHNSPHVIPSYDHYGRVSFGDVVELLVTADEATYNYILNADFAYDYEVVGHIREGDEVTQ